MNKPTYLFILFLLSGAFALNEVLNPLISVAQPAAKCAARTASGNCGIATYPANYPCPCYGGDGGGGAVPGTGQPVRANPDVNLFVDEVVVGGLGNPISVAYTDNTRKAFIGNKDGQIYWFDVMTKERRLWIDLSAEVQNAGDKGLIGLTTAPNFAANPYVFVTYVVDPIYGAPDEPATQPTYQRLIRLTDNNGATTLSTRRILIGNTAADSIPLCSSTHMIGQVRFGHDGSLILSAGDGGRWEFPDFGQNNFDDDHICEDLFGARNDIGNFRSQARWTGAGKILRLDPNTGQGICPGVGGGFTVMNPYCNGNPNDWQSKIWAEGVRNPWRLNIRPLLPGEQDDGGPGKIYFSEVGDNGFEEVNVVSRAGQNFGWPCWEGPLPQALIKGYPLHDDPNANPNRVDPRLNCRYVYQNVQTTTPFFTYSRWAAGTGAYGEIHYTGQGFLGNSAAGVVHYTGQLYPAQYRYTVWIADFAQRWIKVIDKTAQDTYQSIRNFYDFANPILSMETEPLDGNIVYLNFATGELRMIKYAPNNVPPVMKISATPTAGTTPLRVQFSSDGSADRDNDRMEIWWDFGDGTQSYHPNPVKTYNNPGVYTVTLYGRATGAVGTATVVINANNSPPRPRITSPVAVNGIYEFDYDETLAFKSTIAGGTAPFSYKWTVNLIHLNHIHPDQYSSTLPAPSVSVAAIGGDSHPIGTRVNFWLVLTVTDANGLVGTDSIFLSPSDPQENSPPAPAITISDLISQLGSSIREVGQPVSFSAQTTNDPNLDYVLYSWNFGDGASDTWGLVNNPVLTTHAYAAPGTYTVTLTTRDNFGASAVATQRITISGTAIPPPNNNPPPPNPNPVPNPVPPSPVAPPTEVKFTLPGRVDLVDFRHGKNNEAYYDTTDENIPNQYRPTDSVDIEVCDDITAGHSIGYVEPGEWLTYSVTVPTASSFEVRVRYAFPDDTPVLATRKASLFLDGSATPFATFTLPSTGGWTHWFTSAPITSPTIAAGNHVLRVLFETGWWRVNWISFGSGSGNPATPPPPAVPPPVTPSQFVINLPGTLQAEDYTPGRQGQSYYDTTDQNFGGSTYRPGTSVDIQTTGDITFLGYLEPNEWLRYTVNIAKTSQYQISARYAYPPSTSIKANRQIRLYLDNEATPLAVLSMPPTLNWDTWGLSPVAVTSVPITAGRHVITLRNDHSYWRLDSLNFVAVTSNNKRSLASAAMATELKTDITHYILDDGFVMSSPPDKVFNTYGSILVSNYNNDNAIGLVKINMLALDSHITSAKLRLHVTDVRGPADISIFPLNTEDWSEDAVTWNAIKTNIESQKEALDTRLINSVGIAEWDITSAVQIAQIEKRTDTLSFYFTTSQTGSDNRIVMATKESRNVSERVGLSLVAAPKPLSLMANSAMYNREGMEQLPIDVNSVVVEGTKGSVSNTFVYFNIFNLRPVSTYRLRMFGEFVGVGCMTVRCIAATNNDAQVNNQYDNGNVSRPAEYNYLLAKTKICNAQPQWYEWDVSYHVRELLVKDALNAAFELVAESEPDTGDLYQAPKRIVFRGVAHDGYDPRLELDVDAHDFVLVDEFDKTVYAPLNLDDLAARADSLALNMSLLLLCLLFVVFV